MSKILQISSESVTLGLDDGSLQVYSLNSCNGFVPEVGLEVDVYTDGVKTIIVKKHQCRILSEVLVELTAAEITRSIKLPI